MTELERLAVKYIVKRDVYFKARDEGAGPGGISVHDTEMEMLTAEADLSNFVRFEKPEYYAEVYGSRQEID
jgi:hypothetical protein